MSENPKPQQKKFKRHIVTDKMKANLKKWAPGQSGNPAGRKPGVPNVRYAMRRKLMEIADQGDKTNLEAMIDALIKLAIEEGCPTRFKVAMDYSEGPLKQALDLNVSVSAWNEKPIEELDEAECDQALAELDAARRN